MLSGNGYITLYHVETEVEYRYLDVFDALESLQCLEPITPWVSNRTMLGEDEMTPRICVAESLENCISGCGLYRFKRCCENVPVMQHFAVGGEEAHPIIVQTYRVPLSELHRPTPKEVPDAALTGEFRCGFNHPWLNRRGHCLDSLAPEDDEICWSTKCLAKTA